MLQGGIKLLITTKVTALAHSDSEVTGLETVLQKRAVHSHSMETEFGQATDMN